MIEPPIRWDITYIIYRCIHYSVRHNGIISKLATYIILGINLSGKKEVLTISIGENESSKYWLQMLNDLKNRGIKNVLVICADGLNGIQNIKDV